MRFEARTQPLPPTTTESPKPGMLAGLHFEGSVHSPGARVPPTQVRVVGASATRKTAVRRRGTEAVNEIGLSFALPHGTSPVQKRNSAPAAGVAEAVADAAGSSQVLPGASE